MLRIENISMAFGRLWALSEVRFGVRKGQIKALIGPNGAGKTTLFNIISGFDRAMKGEVSFQGERITRKAPHEICRRGLVRTFQITRLFKDMTVLENVMVGCQLRTGSGMFSSGLRLPSTWTDAREIEQRSLEITEMLGLKESRDTIAENLPMGEQKLLEIGRALGTSPVFMLLDEPAGGLNDLETERLAQTIRTLRDSLGITMLIVEHDMGLVMDVADEIVVLNYGRQIGEGHPEEIQQMESVITAYLGKRVEGSQRKK